MQLAEGNEESPREDLESQVITKNWKDKAQCFLLSEILAPKPHSLFMS